MQHQVEERVFILYLILITFFLLFWPIISISHIETGETENVLLWSGILFKSFFIIIIALLVLVGWNTTRKVRDAITLLFWFKENPFLLNFWLLWLILTSYIGIGEGIQTAREVTTSITLTSGYYITIFLLLGGLIYTLYLTLQKAKWSKKNATIHIQEQERPMTETPDGLHSLFGKMKQEHKRIGE